jgi:beta-glucosidase-like glycosyl hydrolase
VCVPTLDQPILVPAIRLDRDDGTEEATALRRAKEPWVAGFLLFGGEAEQVSRLTERLRHEAGRPIFVASDMERGAGQQVKGLTELPDAGIVGLAGSPEDAHAFGEITAREATSVGVDVIFAPVVDVRSELHNPIVGNRSFGWDPERVGILAAAFCRGVHAGGAHPVAKHYPGHGATQEDSHDAVPVVRDDADLLHRRDIAPFQRVIADGECRALMTAHVAYPGLDESGVIATFSKPILDRWRPRGSPGAIAYFTDALLMAGAAEGIGEVEAARRALRAGCDALLYPESPERVAADLLETTGTDLPASAEAAAARLAMFARTQRPDLGEPDPSLFDVPAAVARRAVAMATAGRLAPGPDCLWVLDDDDVASRGTVLAERARAHGAHCQVVRIPRGEVPEVPAEPVVYGVVVVLASVGAWKGSPWVRRETYPLAHDLANRRKGAICNTEIVWCAPYCSWPGLLVPGTGPHVEAALADALFGEDVGHGA